MIGYSGLKTVEEKLRLAQALHYIKTLDELAPIRGWLRSELKGFDVQNRCENDMVLLHRRQGAALVLESLLKLVEEAQATAESIRKSVRL